MAKACLERGVNVLCEKPLGIDVPSTSELIACAKRSRAALLLATKFRHVPEIRLAREHIRAGDVGTPLLFEIEFSSVVNMTERWNSTPSISGGGVIIDNGCHALDIVSYLFGGVASVQALRLPSVQPLDVEDSALLLVSTTAGVPGQITVSWSMNALRDTYLRVRGSRGTIRIGWRSSLFLKREDGERTPVPLGDGYDKVAAHNAMMRACRDVIVGHRETWVSHAECLATAAAVEAAYRSLECGGWVKVDRDLAKGEAA